MQLSHSLSSLFSVSVLKFLLSLHKHLQVCITLPMIYGYVIHVRQLMHSEVNFCQGSAKEIWHEVSQLRAVPSNHTRFARQYVGEGNFLPDCLFIIDCFSHIWSASRWWWWRQLWRMLCSRSSRWSWCSWKTWKTWSPWCPWKSWKPRSCAGLIICHLCTYYTTSLQTMPTRTSWYAICN